MTAQAIIFAINSAIRLGRNVQKAYANSLKSKAIMLPLPSFSSKVNLFTISRFFDEAGARFVNEIEVLKYLHRKQSVDNLNPEEQEKYQEYYRALFHMVDVGETDPDILNAGINIDDVVGLLKIRQWERNHKFATNTLQLVAGTIVEIGIDYFNQFPGAINQNSALGKALTRFLSAMDRIPFSEQESFKKALSEKVLPRLFITAAETLQEINTDIVRDEKWQSFIAVTSKGITEDLYKRIGPDMSIDETEEAIQWGQLLLSSMVRNAGYYVFSDPSQVFKVSEGQEKLIQNTGLTLLNLLYAEDELKIDLKAVLNYEALDDIMRSSFEIFAEYPELLAKEDSIRLLIRDIALALIDSDLGRPEMLPEILRIIIEKTASNIDKLWDFQKDQPEHLLVIALQQILESLTYKPEGQDKWQLKFSKTQMISIFYQLFDEVIDNPAWVTRKLGDQELLKEVVTASLIALSKLPPQERLSYEVFELLLELNLRLVATSPRVLNKISFGSNEEEATVLNKVLDFVFEYIFRPEPNNPVERKAALRLLLNYLMDTILIRYPDSKGLLLIEMLLSEEHGLKLGLNTPQETIEQLGDLLLDFLIIYPELFSKDSGVQTIIIDLAESLQEADLNQAGILPEILAIVLNQISRNIDQFLVTKEGEAKYLLSIALKEILKELSHRNEAGEWRPSFSGGHMVSLVDTLLDEVLTYPEWITDEVDQNTLLAEVLNVTFRALKNIPRANRLSLDTLLELLEINMRSVVRNPNILNKIDWTTDEEEVIVLEKGIDLIFSYVYAGPTIFTLNRTTIASELLDYALKVILSKHPDHFGLELLAFLLSEDSGIDLSKGLDDYNIESFVDLLLQIITERPEFLSEDPSVQNVITSVAATLEEEGLDRPGFLPEVLRLMLIYAADESKVLFEGEEESLKTILVDALNQILEILTQKPSNGKWKPQLSGDQMLELVLFLLEEVRENPAWLGKHQRIYNILNAIFKAFEYIPNHRKLSFSLIKLIIIKIFEAVRKHPEQLLETTIGEGNEKVLLLFYILKELFKVVYENSKAPEAITILQQPSVIDALLDYFLYRISISPSDKASIDQVVLKVKRSILDLEDGKVGDDDAFIDLLRNNLV